MGRRPGSEGPARVPAGTLRPGRHRCPLGLPGPSDREVAAGAFGRAQVPDAGLRYGVPAEGLSGAIRKVAYRRYSEGRAAHWLLLLAADRVNAGEAHLKSMLTLRPDNPITETGVLSEFSHRGIASRVGQKRADLVHQPLDPIIVAGPWLVAGGLIFVGVRAVLKARRG